MNTTITVTQDVIPNVTITTAQQGPTGPSLQFTWDGTRLGVKKVEDSEYTYRDLALKFENLTSEQKDEILNSIIPSDANYVNTFTTALG